MRKSLQIGSIFILLLGLSLAGVYAQEGKTVRKSFDAKPRLDIKVVSGACEIVKGGAGKIEVEVTYDVTPENAFKPVFRESSGSLRLEEDWDNASRGRVEWVVKVPEKTEIDFSSASGDFRVEGLETRLDVSTASGDCEVLDCKGDLDVNTASGDVTVETYNGKLDVSTASGDVNLRNVGDAVEISTASGDVDAVDVKGQIDISTASGDMDLSDMKGVMELSCASGNIEAADVVLEDAGEFSTASGEVHIGLAQSAAHDLKLSSASGDVVLDYQGNPVKGTFVFTARKDRGRIRSPFPFDKEEEFKRHGKTYMEKSFSKNGKAPLIELSTASGTAELRK
jgi:DUF4097 and DUF4098 domain-containing protein YvlB